MIFDERDVLLKAASIVEEGWCQNTAHVIPEGFTDISSATHSCAVGALWRAILVLNGTVATEKATQLYNKTRWLFEGHIGAGDIPDWNDAPGRTADEVAEAMRKAANGNLG